MKVQCLFFVLLLAACSGEKQQGNDLSSMATDKGLFRTLPPAEEVPIDDTEDSKRNIMIVLVNSNDELMVNGERMDFRKLKPIAKEFIANPSNNDTLPMKEAVDIPLLGKRMVTSKHVIYLNNEQGTSYSSYSDVQNELLAAYSDLRDELSVECFSGRKFQELTADEQEAVKQCYPQKISEELPKSCEHVK